MKYILQKKGSQNRNFQSESQIKKNDAEARLKEYVEKKYILKFQYL